MSRTCLACSSPERAAIDNALVVGEPLRNIAERVSISPPSLLRHKQHVSQALVKAADAQKEKHAFDLLTEARRVRDKAWELLDTMQSEGDHRGSVVALREVRECLGTLGTLLSGADGAGLAGVSDDAILAEAKRRGLKVPVTVNVVYEKAEIRNPNALRRDVTRAPIDFAE